MARTRADPFALRLERSSAAQRFELAEAEARAARFTARGELGLAYTAQLQAAAEAEAARGAAGLSRRQVEVARIRLDELSPHHLSTLRRRRVGLVLEHFNLIPHRTVAENVDAAEALDLVGLAGRADVQARDLDAGERVRVALARALKTSPAVVLVDAPGLDPALLRRAVDTTGTAIVFATDDETVAAGADRVVRM